MEIQTRNVNQALCEGLWWLNVHGVRENSRNGPVVVSPEPVMTTYTHPRERVLFSPLRDANPFFHLIGEALWMLAGRNDLKWPVYFNKRFAEYSDDGVTCHGAYGYRWRKAFNFDQLSAIARELRTNPESRRCVLQMWDSSNHSVEIEGYNPRLVGMDDWVVAIHGGKDVPCNTHVYFDARGGRLNMTVLCRSNDIWWGAYGANAVHFSVLQEYMAFTVGIPVGVYRQFSNNFHIYTAVVPEGRFSEFATDAKEHDAYQGQVEPFPLISTSIEVWEKDLQQFLSNPAGFLPHMYADPFFREVAVPMYAAWHLRKNHREEESKAMVDKIAASDWRLACTEWIQRREAKRAATRS